MESEQVKEVIHESEFPVSLDEIVRKTSIDGRETAESLHTKVRNLQPGSEQ